MSIQSETARGTSFPSADGPGTGPNGEADRVRGVLRQIGRLVDEFLQDAPTSSTDRAGHGAAATAASTGCHIMPLPPRLHERAAEVASKINPVNAPLEELASLDGGMGQPQRLTLTTSKYWGPKPKTLTVSFMETAPADLKERIISHLNAWSCGIRFAGTSGRGDIRISREPGGYWSYLGTDTRLIPTNRQTMNLQGFTMNTPESEYLRVVRHEAGHTLGFPHEHMRRALVERIDPQKAYAYFEQRHGWDRETVDQQVLTPLDIRSIIGTEPDQDSIMCYQLPGDITKDGAPITGGADINQSDFAFADIIYPSVLWSPGTGSSGGALSTGSLTVIDWDPSEDVPATE
ncbi:hypothetical protein RF644_10155 [Kocuria sp. CPCC 205258]|uniref:hypothetical protein n=1 Tax=Kocuria sp. CPCC 205258 TaxID=3073552 RepID=UPI0034D59AF7